jgi:hypothetical protein
MSSIPRIPKRSKRAILTSSIPVAAFYRGLHYLRVLGPNIPRVTLGADHHGTWHESARSIHAQKSHTFGFETLSLDDRADRCNGAGIDTLNCA